MDGLTFDTKYPNFSELIEDVNHVVAHYRNQNLVVGYDVYPQSLIVTYNVTNEEGQAI